MTKNNDKTINNNNNDDDINNSNNSILTTNHTTTKAISSYLNFLVEEKMAFYVDPTELQIKKLKKEKC